MYPITTTRRLSTIKEEKGSRESLLATSYSQPLNKTFEIIEFNDTSTPSAAKRPSIDNIIDIDAKSDDESIDYSRTLIKSILNNKTPIKRQFADEIYDNDATLCPTPRVYDEPKDYLRVCLKCNVGFKTSKYSVDTFNKHLIECTSYTCKYCHLICMNNNGLIYHLKEKHEK
jgi:hypothetical protein